MPELVVDLDKLDLGELFDIRHQEAGDIIKGAVGLTIPARYTWIPPLAKTSLLYPVKPFRTDVNPLLRSTSLGPLKNSSNTAVTRSFEERAKRDTATS